MIPPNPNISQNDLHAAGPAAGGPPAPQRAQATALAARPSPPPPAAVAAKPDALALLKALRRRWPLALGVGLLCAAVAASAAWTILPPPSYRAEALLQASSIPPRVIFQTNESWVDFRTFQRNQQRLIRSRMVLVDALRDPAVLEFGIDERVEDPIVWLEQKIQAGFDGEMLTIAMNGGDPDEVAALVNAVTDSYLENVVAADSKSRLDRMEDLRKIHDDLQDDLKKDREELRTLADQLGSDNEETNQLLQETLIGRRAALQGELDALRTEIRMAQAELDVKQAQAAEAAEQLTIPEAQVEAAVESEPYVRQYRERIAGLESELSEGARLARKPSDPSRLNVAKELAAARQELERRRRQLIPLYEEQLRQRALGAFESGLQALRDEIAIGQKKEEYLAAMVDSLAVETKEHGQRAMDLTAMQDEIQYREEAVEKLGNELAALEVELEQTPERVREIELAKAPRLEADKRPKMAGMAGLGAFALVVLGVSFAEYRARKIGSVEEVVGGLGLPVVGTVPPLGRRGRGGARSQGEASLLVESIDAARTYLLHASRHEGVRAVMVTSAGGGEGKTSLACHLATSLARAGRRTLLIDGDLRRPAVHRLFDLPPVPGLGELVREEAELDQVVQVAPAPNLEIVTAGRGDGLAVQALAQDHVRALFDRVRGRYDFVIVDTPPVLAVADALLIGQHVDAAVCSILRDVSRVPLVHAARQRLQSLGIRILGAVVTGVHGDLEGQASYRYAEATAEAG